MAPNNPNDRDSSPGTPPAGELPQYSESLNLGNSVRDIQAICFLLLDKLWLIGLIVMFGVVLTASYIVSRPKMYQATATIQVERQDQSEINANAAFEDAQAGLEQLNTIVGKFESRALLVSVLTQAGLISTNAAAAVSDATAGDASVTNAPLSKEDARRVNAFASRIKVTLRRNTRLIDISVKDGNADQAAKLANLMISEYLKQDFSIKSTTSKRESEFFRAEYERLAKKVQTSEQDLQDYENEVGTAQLANPSDEELQECQKQLTLAQADMIRAKSAYDKSLMMGTNVNELLAYSTIASDPQVQSYQAAIAQKESDLIQLKQQYREKNPKYILAWNVLLACVGVECVGMMCWHDHSVKYATRHQK